MREGGAEERDRTLARAELGEGEGEGARMNGAIESRIPEAEYRALPGVSITRLKELKRSPKHYRYRLDHPRETAPLTLGGAAHVACLEPERFDRDFATWTRRTASGAMAPRKGQWWDAFC